MSCTGSFVVYPGRVIVDFSVLLLTFVVGCMGTGVFLRYGRGLQFPLAMQQQKALNLRAIAGFTDSYNSKLIFAIDGIFLYLESYFGLISLFLVVGESFVRLGVLMIVLAIILGSLFFAIKNRIDCLDKQKVYISSVLLYMVSWGLRGTLSLVMQLSTQVCLLMVVAFCTVFFRLAFNKRFFETAQKSSMYRFFFIKSYFSQLFLVVGFGIVGWLDGWHPVLREFLPFSMYVNGLLGCLPGHICSTCLPEKMMEEWLTRQRVGSHLCKHGESQLLYFRKSWLK